MLCAVNLWLNFAWHVYSCVLKMADPIKTRCFVDYASGSGEWWWPGTGGDYEGNSRRNLLKYIFNQLS